MLAPLAESVLWGECLLSGVSVLMPRCVCLQGLGGRNKLGNQFSDLEDTRFGQPIFSAVILMWAELPMVPAWSCARNDNSSNRNRTE